MTTVAVAGALANKPLNAGEAWVRLSWIRGLQSLGFDVVFVEEIDRATCVSVHGTPCAPHDSVNVAYWRQVIESFDLGERAALLDTDGRSLAGVRRADLDELLDGAALLCNISGHLRVRELRAAFGVSVFVDLDPGFTQFWAAQGADVNLDGHDLYYTVGINIGASTCDVPAAGVHWRSLPPFFVPDDWPRSNAATDSPITTVATWRSYGRVSVGSRTFTLKAHQFRRFVQLPQRVDARFEIALDIHHGDHRDRELLERHGWRLRDPRAVVRDPDAFRRYVRHSSAEFSVAQGIYVETCTGWLGDRTVRYLASGRPAIVQDTGLGAHLPTGTGLLTFSTLEQAIAGIEDLAAAPERHAAAARRLADEYLDARRVLGRVLEDTGTAP
ncbi:MAG: hypothetical protein KY469_19200 [Actinobacteria bacterium]|nr:hypothetical protein [Actinomycetota bacterium]